MCFTRRMDESLREAGGAPVRLKSATNPDHVFNMKRRIMMMLLHLNHDDVTALKTVQAKAEKKKHFRSDIKHFVNLPTNRVRKPNTEDKTAVEKSLVTKQIPKDLRHNERKIFHFSFFPPMLQCS